MSLSSSYLFFFFFVGIVVSVLANSDATDKSCRNWELLEEGGEADDRIKVRIVDGEREGPTTAFFCELLLRDVMGSCTTVLDSSAL